MEVVVLGAGVTVEVGVKTEVPIRGKKRIVLVADVVLSGGLTLLVP